MNVGFPNENHHKDNLSNREGKWRWVIAIYVVYEILYLKSLSKFAARVR